MRGGIGEIISQRGIRNCERDSSEGRKIIVTNFTGREKSETNLNWQY